MTIDRYSRVVLTVIALALLWLCLRENPTPATAAGPIEVKVVGWSVSSYQGIPVEVKSVSLSQRSSPMYVRVEK
jgi:hypothetical protein